MIEVVCCRQSKWLCSQLINDSPFLFKINPREVRGPKKRKKRINENKNKNREEKKDQQWEWIERPTILPTTTEISPLQLRYRRIQGAKGALKRRPEDSRKGHLSLSRLPAVSQKKKSQRTFSRETQRNGRGIKIVSKRKTLYRTIPRIFFLGKIISTESW